MRDKTDANLRTEPGKPMEVQAGGRRQRRHVRRLHRVARQASLRRPDDAAAQRRVRGRARRDAHAHPPGGAHLHRGDRRRGQRDDRPAHRLAGQGARRASRPAPRGRRGPLADPERDRRDAAVRADRARHRPLRHARTSSTTARRCPRAARSCCSLASANRDPRRYERARTSSTSTATTSSTSPSATGCTSASAPTSPGSRAASRSTSS